MILSFSCRCLLLYDERRKRWEANYKDIRVDEIAVAVLIGFKGKLTQMPYNHCP